MLWVCGLFGKIELLRVSITWLSIVDVLLPKQPKYIRYGNYNSLQGIVIFQVVFHTVTTVTLGHPLSMHIFYLFIISSMSYGNLRWNNILSLYTLCMPYNMTYDTECRCNVVNFSLSINSYHRILKLTMS